MTPEPIPSSVDKAARRELERALRLAHEHPGLFALLPVGNLLLALGLGLYSLAHLAMTFVLCFGR